ncbi:hypothetical protein KY347_06270 [Candidatus Woesearchaeota archaeon]|nr:hypothetical protein [Candidatus Woesearchaeota archaeon]
MVVKWPNVAQTTKQMKEGFIRGWIHDFAMFGQICKAVSFFEVIKQLLVMRWLSAKYKKEVTNKLSRTS